MDVEFVDTSEKSGESNQTLSAVEIPMWRKILRSASSEKFGCFISFEMMVDYTSIDAPWFHSGQFATTIHDSSSWEWFSFPVSVVLEEVVTWTYGKFEAQFYANSDISDPSTRIGRYPNYDEPFQVTFVQFYV